MNAKEKDPMRYSRVVVSKHGGPDVLKLVKEDLPEPDPGEVRLRVLAAGISAYDLMFRKSGSFPGAPRLPFTPGEDIVGVVDKLGEGVFDLEPGQVVAGWTLSLGVGGGYTESICLPSQELVPVPPGVDPAEAVCVIINYLTAYSVLHRTAKAKKGDKILVHGAAGGVGTAILQLGKISGLDMYGTASSYNHKVISALGATPIDYKTQDFVESIRSITGEGVDVVFDPIGGARQVLRSYKTLGKNGKLVWFGVASAKKSGSVIIPFTLLMIFLLKCIPGGRKVLLPPDIAKDNTWYRKTLIKLLDLLASGTIKPIISEQIPLSEAASAHELLEHGRYAGKIVLVTSFYTETF